MPALFIYLIKVNAALLIFCAGYYAVLRHLTFYNLNRAYLVTAIIFSTLYPALNLVDFLNRHEEIAKPVQVVILNWQEPVKNIAKTFLGHDIWFWLQAAFWVGVILFAIRLATQLLSLYRLHKRSEPAQLHQYMIRVIKGNINPFSFWRSIYINPENHEPGELSAILEHEQIHVSEWHTLDILLGEISAIFYWFNPGVWLMKRAIRENIEFITDQKILDKGVDSRAYQYSLLNVNFGAQGNAIVNHFNISTIKKRIIMMNAKRSSKVNVTRYLLLLPIVMVLLLVFSVSKAELKKAVKGSEHMVKSLNTVITKIQLKTASAAAIAANTTDHAGTVLLKAVSFFNIDGDTTKKEPAKLPGLELNKDTSNRKKNYIYYSFNYSDDKHNNGEPTRISLQTSIDTNKKAILKLRSNNGEQPDIYINGVKSDAGLENIDANSIYSVNVKKDPGNYKGEIYIVTKGHEDKSTFSINGGVSVKDTVILKRGGGGRGGVSTMTAEKVVIGSNGNNEVVVTGYSTSTNPRIANVRVNGKNISTNGDETIKQIVINGDTIKGNNIYAGGKRNLKIDTMLRTLPGIQIDPQGNVIRNRTGGSRITMVTGYPMHQSAITLANKLIIIDGKEATEKQMKKISADQIESISTLNGDAATTKYGDKGKNGVVVITTKKKS